MNRRELLLGSAMALLLPACKPEEFAADMVAPIASDLPFELFRVPGKHAMKAFEVLSNQFAGRASPAILGPEEELQYFNHSVGVAELGTPQSIIEKARGLEFPTGYRAHLQAEMLRMSEAYKDDPLWQAILKEGDESSDQVPVGNWPSEPIGSSDSGGLSIVTSWETGKPYDEVYIGVFPTSDSTEIPAYIPFGGWNACPLPEWHIAALRHWREEWGANLVGLSHDVMELRVQKRPQTREAAIALAREQYDYCSDIVDQGSGDIVHLAQILMASDWWYFWWD